MSSYLARRVHIHFLNCPLPFLLTSSYFFYLTFHRFATFLFFFFNFCHLPMDQISHLFHFAVTPHCTLFSPTPLLPCFYPAVARCCKSTSLQVCTSWVLSAGNWPFACSSSSPSSTSASGRESRRLER